MKLHILQSFEGDCILLESGDGQNRILCDGATSSAMRTYGAKYLSRFRERGKELDVLYISHIDNDHIGGALLLLETELEWQIWDSHPDDDKPAKPKLPRPPAVQRVWHNAFRDQVEDNVGDIHKLLAAAAPSFSSSVVPELKELGHDYAQIATSIPQALRVSKLLQPKMLDIKLNKLEKTPSASGKLLMARKNLKPETFGQLTVSILGPTAAELDNLREGWKNFLEDPRNEKQLQEVRDMYASALAAGEVGPGRNPFELFKWQGLAAYKGVTVPNVASLVLLVEEGAKRVLLTGDSHPDMILAGLEAQGHLADGYMHLDVLKYPHHGATDNWTLDFSRQLSADHYVFCGDGKHNNPEFFVLDAMLTSRVGPKSKLALSSEAAARKPFHFWFSTSAETPNGSQPMAYMAEVEAWARKAESKYPGVFHAHFNTKPVQVLSV